MHFYGLNYYLCVANSEMLLYGTLKCKESQDSYFMDKKMEAGSYEVSWLNLPI